MELALATVEDVARYLRQSAPTDLNELKPYLEAAEDYVRRFVNMRFEVKGEPVKQEEFSVREQSYVRIRDLAPTDVTMTVTMIANILPPFTPPWILSEGNDFVLEADSHGIKNRIRITSSMYYRIVGYDFAYGKRAPFTWDKVEVDYTASGLIPATIREATALIAAANWKQGPYDVSGLQSERVGDYSYQRSIRGTGTNVSISIPERARNMLKLYRGTRSRST